MEKHPEKLSEGVVRRDGSVTPFNAADAVAVVCDNYPAPIPRQFKARMGKAAKELLEDGFDPQTICEAMFAALRRARVDLIPTMALEIQLAKGGQYMSWRRYQSELESANRQNGPETVIKQALREAFK